jgi:predicted methyltransferase
MIVLSHYQATPILAAMEKGLAQVETSLDLGMSTTVVPLVGETAVLPDDIHLDRGLLEEMVKHDLACYQYVEGYFEKVQLFSETLNRFYSLMPTESAPTMLVSGTAMHRIKDTNPYKDTQMKIKAVYPVVGPVLDTTMGLGYTASMAAETAEKVTTIELDPTVVEICRANPWSQQLFTNHKIERRVGDSFDVVETMDDQAFSRIVHDPPMFKLAGHLYSTDFYRELYRVLKANGRLFHYIGDPKSKSGRSVTKGVITRLYDAGFKRVKPWPQAYGVIALKS